MTWHQVPLVSDGRILGDDEFSENVLARVNERAILNLGVEQLVSVVCKVYKISEKSIVAYGKKQPGAEARGVVAYLIQDDENLSLTELGIFLRRDVSALSKAAGRLRIRLQHDPALTCKLEMIKNELDGMSQCQA